MEGEATDIRTAGESWSPVTDQVTVFAAGSFTVETFRAMHFFPKSRSGAVTSTR